MSARPRIFSEPCAVSAVEKALEVALGIAQRGYGAPVIRLAALRKGLTPETAEVIVIVAQRLASLPPPPVVDSVQAAPAPAPATAPASAPAAYRDDTGRAAAWALRGLSRFVFYALLAAGGGAAIGAGFGWEAGFTEGHEDSARRLAFLLRELGLY